LNPKPAGDARDNGCQDVAQHANQPMRNFCMAFDLLLQEDCDDYDMLTAREKKTNNVYQLAY
jgi:hypothetical protein